MSGPPSAQVLAAFGLRTSELRPLAGGQGDAWCTDDVVLKPVASVEETEWLAPVLAALPENGFRLARPVPAASGAWSDAGWSANRLVAGAHDLRSRWPDVLAVGSAFHTALRTALRDTPRPAFLDARRHAWAEGDRAAWSDQSPNLHHPELAELVARLHALRRPNSRPCQLIHGDLSGNVLFADPLPPAVIDVTPYWRPAAFGLAVVVVDAIAWHGAGRPLARLLAHLPDAVSLLARATIYRLITADRAAIAGNGDQARFVAEAEAHLRVADVVESMQSSR